MNVNQVEKKYGIDFNERLMIDKFFVVNVVKINVYS